MTKREVTEQDLRMPVFRDAKLEDLEFRDDGVIVRRDRWEMGFRSIVNALGMSRTKFEIPEVVDRVRALVEAAEVPKTEPPDVEERFGGRP